LRIRLTMLGKNLCKVARLMERKKICEEKKWSGCGGWGVAKFEIKNIAQEGPGRGERTVYVTTLLEAAKEINKTNFGFSKTAKEWRERCGDLKAKGKRIKPATIGGEKRMGSPKGQREYSGDATLEGNFKPTPSENLDGCHVGSHWTGVYRHPEL